MSMSRKDYVAIANVLAEVRESGNDSWPSIASRFADLFEADNPRFDRGRFLAAVSSPSQERS